MQEFDMTNHSHFSISRDGDEAGDSGSLLESIDPSTLEVTPGAIKVGCRIRCGSRHARSYHHQDWWLTTKVVEIFDAQEGEFFSSCRFKTESGSVYICNAH